jgi:thioredoxin reductase
MMAGRLPVWDVVVVGGGNAALTAAVTARQAGFRPGFGARAQSHAWRQ